MKKMTLILAAMMGLVLTAGCITTNSGAGDLQVISAINERLSALEKGESTPVTRNVKPVPVSATGTRVNKDMTPAQREFVIMIMEYFERKTGK